MQMTQLQPFVAPNAAGDLLAKQTYQANQAAASGLAASKLADQNLAAGRLNLDVAKFGGEQSLANNKLALEIQKFTEEKKATERKNKTEEMDFVLNVTAGVNSEEDMGRARDIINARYPQYSQKTNELLSVYDPGKIRMMRNALQTETQRLKLEEQTADRKTKEIEAANKLEGFAPGTQVFRGGEELGRVGFKPDAPQGFELFTDPSGNQAYLREGSPVPAGYKRVDKKTGPSVIVQTGDLGKSATTQLQKDVVQGVQNVQSFRETRKLFKPEYLTLFGKGEKEVAEGMDKIGLSSDKQKELIAGRAKWFRQAKQDFIAYRKWATGVAGGEKEMEEIATAFPDPVKNSPTQYTANLDSIEETTKRILQLNADFLKLGINLDQPLDKIIAQAKAAGLDIQAPPLGDQEVTITFVRDSAGNLVRSDQ
jgi:hypothetical protein